MVPGCRITPSIRRIDTAEIHGCEDFKLRPFESGVEGFRYAHS